MIKLLKPLKAPTESITNEQLQNLEYPFLGSPKIDGIRCLIIDGEPKTSSFKLQPNLFIRNSLASFEFNGLDGELVVGESNSPEAFNNSTGPIRRQSGEPDFKFLVFDNFLNPNAEYYTRWIMPDFKFSNPRVQIIPQILLHSPENVIDFTNKCISLGFEGAMIRSLTGKYKQGRATFLEKNIFKRKPLEDAEAVIIDFIEQMTNLNPEEINELGLTKRSKRKENLIPGDTLGSFVLKSPLWPTPFTCGGGKLNHEQRKEVWDNRKNYVGKKVTFKYQAHGSINAPRQPIFKSFYKKD